MAQDFYAACRLGSDDKSVGIADVRDVALAAIQGLNQKLIEQIKAKDQTIAKLSARLAAIDARLGLK